MDLIKLFRETADESWKPMISEIKQKFGSDIKKIEKKLNKLDLNFVYPHQEHIFNAFRLTKLNDCRAVILGQDPYHQGSLHNSKVTYFPKLENVPQANGLAFSVSDGVKIPSSLRNIFKNLKQTTDFKVPVSGNLKNWTKQGVLLLNCSLTVEESRPNSHARLWEKITDFIIEYISSENENLIFLLWGSNSLRKKELIKNTEHILISSHPSGLSANKPLKEYPSFMENQHFVKTNEILEKLGKEKINFIL